MELILQTGLEHQQRPVEAVCGVFKEVAFEAPSLYFENPIFDLSQQRILANIREVQSDPDFRVHSALRGVSAPDTVLNLDIKMETGTGKTYVYTNTIYELHKRYGINKFIIAVPTLPIKAGVKSFLSDPYVRRHFKGACGYGTSIELCELTASKPKKGRKLFPSVVRTFVEGSCQNRNKIYVLLVNMALLTSGKLLSDDTYDYGVQGFYRPFDALRSVRPFVIIDEPHRFARDQKAYSVILNEFKPQCVIRYGATFPNVISGKGKMKAVKKDYLNLLYDLDACDAFNSNLIKGVAKEHFEPEGSLNEKIRLAEITAKESVTFVYRTSSASRSYTLTVGESLGIISDDLSGLSVTGIGKDHIELSNGQEKRKGEEFEVGIYSSSYQEQMIRLAIQRHFETERQNFNRNIRIKTLALFFIDNIESFRGNDEGKGAWLREMFDRLLLEQTERELQEDNTSEYRDFLEATRADVACCRAGYFAQDNNDSDEAVAQEVRDILQNKKELLSFRKPDGSWNTRRFLFSKWTLKEGWDNPNVFTITKLRSSGSENSKLQEVGRGLRLPVDEYGNRISNEEFLLNYIVDFTEADFAGKLVAQINAELPGEPLTVVTPENLIRVADLRGLDQMMLMMQLYQKGYILDVSGKINPDKITEFYEEYPEFNNDGIGKSKIIDRNKITRNTVRIRKAGFAELSRLWTEINRKYVLFFDSKVDELIERDFYSIVSDGVFAFQTVTSVRERIDTSGGMAALNEGGGVQYSLVGREIPYREFLVRASKATSVPVKVIHKAICRYARENDFKSSFINDSSLTRLINNFEQWKCSSLMGCFKYRRARYNSAQTALTYPDGSLKEEIVQGLVGVHIEKTEVPEKYLYDTLAYDSPLERANIMSEVEDVVVYGKIPRRSISIPTIAGSSYSPDFMYVVKRRNGEKELNIVVETKDVENRSILRENEQAKISCAEQFFRQLEIDGYTVHFKTQLNNRTMRTIISELIEK